MEYKILLGAICFLTLLTICLVEQVILAHKRIKAEQDTIYRQDMIIDRLKDKNLQLELDYQINEHFNKIPLNVKKIVDNETLLRYVEIADSCEIEKGIEAELKEALIKELEPYIEYYTHRDEDAFLNKTIFSANIMVIQRKHNL